MSDTIWVRRWSSGAVTDRDFERVRAFEGAALHAGADAPARAALVLIDGDAPDDAPELDAPRCDPAEFRRRYGLGLTPDERLAALRRAAASGLPSYYRWPVATALLAGCDDEDERRALAAEANARMADLAPGDRWIARGALDDAMAGRPAASSAGASLWLQAQHDRACAEWLLADPSRVPNLRELTIAGDDPAWALEVLRRLAGRRLDCVTLTQLGTRAWGDVLAALPADVGGVGLNYGDGGLALIKGLAAHPAWKALRTLRAHKNDAKAKGLKALVKAKKTAAFTELDLGYNGLNSEDFAALAAAPWLDGVRALTVKYNDARVEGGRALLASPRLHALERLDVGANEIGDEGLAALFANPAVTSLAHLECEGNGQPPLVTVEGAARLGAWPGATSLRTLNLAKNKLGDEGLAALLKGEHLAGLRALDVQYNDCTPKLAASLAGVDTPVRPRAVNLSGNALGKAKFGAKPKAPKASRKSLWADARWLSECEWLNLYNTSLDADTFAQIVCAPALAKVRWLDLSSNYGLGSEALRFLIEAPLARGLDALHVLYWRLKPGDGIALASAPFAATMMNLSVSKKDLDEADVAALQRAYGTRLYLG